MRTISGFARKFKVRALRLPHRPGKKTSVAISAALLAVAMATMAATWFGVGAASKALQITDGEIWLWSSSGGEAQRVNVRSGNVDTRRALTDAQGHDVVVVQTDDHLLLHDRTAGQVTSVDLATLGTTAEAQVKPGTQTSVAMWRDQVLLLDETEGTIRQLDPIKLGTAGKTLTVGAPATPGGFDDNGVYWLTSDGNAIGVQSEKVNKTPQVVKRVRVAPANNKLAVTALDSGIAVADDTSDSVTVVSANDSHTLPVSGLDRPRISQRTYGPTIVIAIPSSRTIVLITGQNVQRLTVPGTGNIGEAVMFGQEIYVIDEAAGRVMALNRSGKVVKELPLSSGGTPTFTRQEGRLVIDDPHSDNAVIVADVNRTTPVQKLKEQVLPDPTQQKKPENPRPTTKAPTEPQREHPQRPVNRPQPQPKPEEPPAPPQADPQLPQPKPTLPGTRPQVRPPFPVPGYPIPGYPYPARPGQLPMPMPVPAFPFGGLR